LISISKNVGGHNIIALYQRELYIIALYS